MKGRIPESHGNPRLRRKERSSLLSDKSNVQIRGAAVSAIVGFGSLNSSTPEAWTPPAVPAVEGVPAHYIPEAEPAKPLKPVVESIVIPQGGTLYGAAVEIMGQDTPAEELLQAAHNAARNLGLDPAEVPVGTVVEAFHLAAPDQQSVAVDTAETLTQDAPQPETPVDLPGGSALEDSEPVQRQAEQPADSSPSNKEEQSVDSSDMQPSKQLGGPKQEARSAGSISIDQLERLGFPNDVATLFEIVSADDPACEAIADLWSQHINAGRIVFAPSTNNRVEISGLDLLDDCRTFTEDLYNADQQLRVANVMLYAVIDYLDEHPERTITINSITTGIPGTNDGHSLKSLHYEGRAIDFGGSREQLQELFTWLLDAYEPVLSELIYAHPTEGFNLYKSGQGNPDPDHNHLHGGFAVDAPAPQAVEPQSIEQSTYECQHEHDPNFTYQLTAEQEAIIDAYPKTASEKQFAKDMLRTLTEEMVRGCYPINLDIAFTQALLETGFGTSSLAREHHNFGGLTAGGSFDGETVFSGDKDVHGNTIQQQFRTFPTFRDGVRGILEFKSEGGKVWYSDALEHRDNADLHLRALVQFLDSDGNEVPVSSQAPATDIRREQYAEDSRYIEKVQNWRSAYMIPELMAAGSVDPNSLNG